MWKITSCKKGVNTMQKNTKNRLVFSWLDRNDKRPNKKSCL